MAPPAEEIVVGEDRVELESFAECVLDAAAPRFHG